MDDGEVDVLPELSVGEDPGSRVLHILEPVQSFGREPRQDSITVVQAGGDEGIDRFGEGGPESGDVFEMVKCWFCGEFYV